MSNTFPRKRAKRRGDEMWAILGPVVGGAVVAWRTRHDWRRGYEQGKSDEAVSSRLETAIGHLDKP